MEGGNKINIDLESGLDISTSDMLVPVSRPTFQHNWQKHQGKFLPNSLRFEMNGWAADWNVFDFDYNDIRVNFDNISVGRTYINDNPTYFINVYKDKKSFKILKSYVMTPESKMLSTNVEFDEDTNEIRGVLVDKPFVITWDPETETADITDKENFELNVTQNGDKSYNLRVRDKHLSYDIVNDFYFTSKLTCPDMIKSQSYSEYKNGVHRWGEFTFDGQKVVTPEEVVVTNFTVTDNELKFSYDLARSEIASLSIVTEEYYTSFDELYASAGGSMSTVDEALTVYSSADPTLDFNIWEAKLNKDNLVAKDTEGITIDQTIPVWFSASVKPANTDHYDGAERPNNVGLSNVVPTPLGPFRGCKATSVFDNVEVNTPADRGIHGINLNWRYNKIELPNAISVGHDFDGRKYKIKNDLVALTGFERFGNFTSGDSRDGLDHIFGIYDGSNYARFSCLHYNKFRDFTDFYIQQGHLVTPEDDSGPGHYYNGQWVSDSYEGQLRSYRFSSFFKFKAFDFIDYNNCYDPMDENSVIYTDSGDISKYCSLKKAGTSGHRDVYEEKTYLRDKGIFTKQAIMDRLFNLRPLTEAETYHYDDLPVSQTKNHYDIYHQGVSDRLDINTCIYDKATGKHVIDHVFAGADYSIADGDRNVIPNVSTTYKEVPTNFEIGPNFWPFKYVPCCNVVTDSKVDIDGKQYYLVIKGVYTFWESTDDDDNTVYRAVTDLEEFKNIVRGHFTDDEHFESQLNNLRANTQSPEVWDSDNEEYKPRPGYSRDVDFLYCIDHPFDDVNFNGTLEPNPAFNTQRVVYNYNYGYDFDYFDIMSNDSKRVAFEERWRRWYPTVACPTSLPRGTSSDTAFFNWHNIRIAWNSECPVHYTKPGIEIMRSLFGIVSLDVLNDADIIPWKTGEQLITKICHNNKDVTDMYESKTSVRAGCVLIDSGILGTPIAENFNENRLFAPLWTYFGDERSGNYCSKSKVAYVPDDATHGKIWVTVKPAERHLIVKKRDPNCWINSIGVSFFGGKGHLGATDYRYDFARTTTWWESTEDEWDIDGYFMAHGVDYAYYNLDVGVEPFDKMYITTDPVDGCVVAQPLKGHLLMRMAYNDIYSKLDIQSRPTKCFTIEKLSDDRCVNDGRIYVDRAASADGSRLRHSVEWFKLKVNSVILGMTGMSSYIDFELKSLAGAGLYFANEARDRQGNKITYDVYYPTCMGKNGHMKYAGSNLCMLRLNWTPNEINVPNAVSFDLKSVFDKPNHKFYDKITTMFRNVETVLPGLKGVDFNTYLTTLDLYIDGDKKDKNKHCFVTFDVKSKQYTFTGTSFTDSNADVNIASITQKTDEERPEVAIGVLCHFNNVKGRFAKVSNDTLVSWSNDNYTCNKGSFEYTYRMLYNNIVGQKSNVEFNDTELYRRIHTSVEVFRDIQAILKNVVDGIFKFTYENVEYEVAISEFNKPTNLSVLSTDIRSPDKTEIIGKIDSEKEFQLVRQQWDTTTAVENFWWVDDDHVLELRNDKFVYKCKTNDLDDWNGDTFVNVYEISRSDILDSTTLRYEVTNTYNTSLNGLLLVFRVKSKYEIECEIRDPAKHLEVIGFAYFSIEHKDLGQKLIQASVSGGTAVLNTYSTIDAYQLITQAQWSNTLVDDYLIIGCHLSNNFDQWAAIFMVNGSFKCERCIQGYGFVGLKGDLTGGMLPQNYFDRNTGFNDTVYDLSELTKDLDASNVDRAHILNDVMQINNINQKVVGTAEKQWYIRKDLYGVVSHLKYLSNGNYSVEVIPMTNKYDSVYKSPSFAVTTYGDLMVHALALNNVFAFEGGQAAAWTALMIAAGYPLLFMFNPRCATLAYLQQTLGQYAYVHYNSSESPVEPEIKNSKSIGAEVSEYTEANSPLPILSDSFTFDKQVVVQSVDNSPVSRSTFFEIICGAFLNELNHIDREIKVNMETNQTATQDTGKKYSQYVSENLAGLAMKGLMTESHQTQALTSKIVGIKSLDMFYSTSDKQNVHAGPGFVEHQFVADCIAQSVTDISAEGKVQQSVFVITALSMYQRKLTSKLEELAADLLEKEAKSVESAMVCGTSWGPAVATGLVTTAYGLRVALAAHKIAATVVDDILNSLGRKNITTTTVNNVSNTALTVEAKHKYGEKNETFMWPCWDVPAQGNKYTDETVNAGIVETSWLCNLPAAVTFTSRSQIGSTSTRTQFSRPASATPSDRDDARDSDNPYYNVKGLIPFYQAACYGTKTERTLPSDMACIQGVSEFLPKQAFKNENIGMSEPVFSPSMFQDYKIEDSWSLSQCCTYGMQQWITVKDTKVTNCPPSNMRVHSTFCGIATPYSAIEVKRGLSKAYMRPWAITPTTLAFNCTGLNCIFDNKLYHAFDGMSYRLVEWTGGPGLNKQHQTFWYSFQVNDRFKRSNKFPANELLGNFVSEPVQSIKSIDKVWTKVTVAAKEKGLEAGTIGEDKDLTRWALPIFTEPVTTLPAAVKTLTAMPLVVVEGITGLVTDLGNNQTAYKAPLSVDFTIGKNVYRQTEEYISSVQTQNGVDIVTDLVPSLGLRFIGSTPTEAYFYSEATRCYYMFSGSTLVKMDMMERFRNVQKGYWDFVNQEVVMPCLMTFKRLNDEVEDKDTETDNIIVPVLSKGQVSGELAPPITTVFNDRSWYKCCSLPSGFVYQGPNRVIINRSVFVEYMLDSLKSNTGKWVRMNREKYVTHRDYPESYSSITEDVNGVKGWTYNPFLLVTSALGSDEDSDCMFEWTITFCWPVEMDLIYGTDNYACVNIMAETMTPGGKQKSRVTHVYLTKEMFTRTNKYGYYSFRFQSKNGAGNRERLHIWSDQYIAISKLDCDVKVITTRRTEQLVQQLDVQTLKEL